MDSRIKLLVAKARSTDSEPEAHALLDKVVELLDSQEIQNTTELKTDVIGDVAVSIVINNRTGQFQVWNTDGDVLAVSETMNGAIARAKPTIAKAKVRVSVPFITTTGKRGVATGFHAGNGAILIKVDGKASTLKKYQTVMKDDIPEEVLADYKTAIEAEREALKKVQTIQHEYRFDLGSAVHKAIEEVSK